MINITTRCKLFSGKINSACPRYKYIVRDGDNTLWLVGTKPFKGICEWEGFNTSADSMGLFKDLFQFITWQDEEPTHLQTLLDNCEVVEDA